MSDTKSRLDLPYIQAAGDGGLRSMTQMIVIHATDNTASAEAEASYASRRTDDVSCHVFVDDDSAVQALPLDHVAWGCFPIGNSRSIQLELCGRSGSLSAATIARAAGIVARIVALWGVPVRKVGPQELRDGVHGICGHADVTLAWGQGDHMDPGTFPWASFINQIETARGMFSMDTSGQVSNVYQAIFYGGTSCGTAVTLPDGKTSNSLVAKLDELLRRPVAGQVVEDPADVQAAVAAAVQAAIAAALVDPNVLKAIAAAVNNDAAARLAQ